MVATASITAPLAPQSKVENRVSKQLTIQSKGTKKTLTTEKPQKQSIAATLRDTGSKDANQVHLSAHIAKPIKTENKSNQAYREDKSHLKPIAGIEQNKLLNESKIFTKPTYVALDRLKNTLPTMNQIIDPKPIPYKQIDEETNSSNPSYSISPHKSFESSSSPMKKKIPAKINLTTSPEKYSQKVKTRVNPQPAKNANILSKSVSSIAGTSTLSDEGFNDSSILLPESMQMHTHLMLNDLDKFEGRRVISDTEEGNHVSFTSDEDLEESDLGPKATSGDVALSIPPAKPSDKQLQVTRRMFSGGLRPKDRDFVANMRSTSERKKLAPPLLGKTTGHGGSVYLSDVPDGKSTVSFPISSSISMPASGMESSMVSKSSEYASGRSLAQEGVIKVNRPIIL
jgi:hypothetical protein